jgi:hypothetical protein
MTLMALWDSTVVDSSVANWFVFQTGLAVGDDSHAPVLSLRLYQNYPNPFNGRTNFEYVLPSAARVVLQVFDLLSRHVRTLEDRFQVAGSHLLFWDSGVLPSGVYFVVLKSGMTRSTIRCQVIK